MSLFRLECFRLLINALLCLSFQVRIPEEASDRCHGCRRPHPHSPLRRSWPWLQELKTGKYFNLKDYIIWYLLSLMYTIYVAKLYI